MQRIKSFLLSALAVLMFSCTIDDNYHLFINAPEPDHFSIAVPAASMSICDIESGNSSITAVMQAINEDDTINQFYRRSVSMVLRDGSGNEYPVSPALSGNFKNGEHTETGIAAAGLVGGTYTLRVKDEKYSDITGVSESFELVITEMDHFTITKSIPIKNDVPFPMTINAIGNDGNLFTSYDGVVNLSLISLGGTAATISPVTVRLNGGVAVFDATISGGSDSVFAINITHNAAASDAAGAECGGGLGDGDGGGGGDGGGSGGGAGGISAPSNIQCELTAPLTPILKNSDFVMTLNVLLKDQFGNVYTEYTGTAAYTDNSPTGDLTPATRTLTTPSDTYGQYRFDAMGEITLTATVTGTGDYAALGLDPCVCTADITVIAGIGIYGDSASALKAQLETNTTLKNKYNFIVINSFSGPADIEPYSGLILNFAGEGWIDRGQTITAAQAGWVNSYWSSGKPVIVAHDKLPNNGLYNIWGITGTTQMTLASAGDPIIAGTCPWAGGSFPGPFLEKYCEGFSASGHATAATITYESVVYPIAIARHAGGGLPKAVVLSEAIYHIYGGELNNETQWWDTNPQFVQNMILWTFE